MQEANNTSLFFLEKGVGTFCFVKLLVLENKIVPEYFHRELHRFNIKQIFVQKVLAHSEEFLEF